MSSDTLQQPGDHQAALNPRLRSFGVGNVLSLTVGIFFKNLGSFLLLTALVYLPLFAVLAAVVLGDAPILRTGSRVAWILLPLAFGILFSTIAQAGVMYATVSALRGRPASFGESLWGGLRRIPAVLGVALLTGLLLALGIYYYLLPGLLVATIVWVAVPAAVIERTGVLGSIKRSDRLTNHTRWPILAMVLIVWVVDFGLHAIVSFGFGEGFVSRGEMLALTFSHVGISVLTTAFSATMAAVGYYSLRIVKEHVAVEELASVFE